MRIKKNYPTVHILYVSVLKGQKDLLTPLCRAVLPHLSLASTLAPLFSREYTQSVCPLRTDSIRGVLRDNRI